MPKRSLRIPSRTTPNHKMQARSWLAEMVMLRRYKKLPPYFWRETKWKFRYTNEVKAASKFIKVYGEPTVVKIVCGNSSLKTLTSYGELEFLLQNEQARLKRLAKPKDTTSVIDEAPESGPDLREPRSTSTKKGLFEALDELGEV